MEYGFTNECTENRRMPMFDLDDCLESTALNAARRLCKGCAVIRTRPHHYFIIGFQLLSVTMWRRLMAKAAKKYPGVIDERYLEQSRARGFSTFRLTGRQTDFSRYAVMITGRPSHHWLKKMVAWHRGENEEYGR